VQSRKSKKNYTQRELALRARTSSPVRDPELLDLFADDPGAIAVVDAIAATRPPTTARPRFASRRLAWVAIAAAVTSALVAAFARDTPHTGVIEHAISAVPTDRVLHFVLEDERPAEVVVNLKTGVRHAQHHAVEEWFDPRTGMRRVRDLVGGVAVRDAVSRGMPTQHDVKGLERFPIVYRTALADAASSNVRRISNGASAAYEIHFRRSRLASAIVDAHTFRPLRVVFRSAGTSRVFVVARMRSLSPQADIPAPVRLQTFVSSATVASSSDLAPSTTRTLFPTRLVGLRLVAVRRLTFRHNRRGWDLTYAHSKAAGRLPSRYLRVQVAAAPYAQLGWQSGLVPVARSQLIAEGAGRVWSGYLRRGEMFIHLVSSEGLAAVIRAARTLVAN